MGLVHFLIDETGSAVAFPITPIGSWLGQAPNRPTPCSCTTRTTTMTQQTTASQSKHGGCRGTVVGAVVEKERADGADVGGGMRRSMIDASSKET